MTDWNWCFDYPREAADKIDKLVQRVAELEKDLSSARNTIFYRESALDEIQVKNYELSDRMAELEQELDQLAAQYNLALQQSTGKTVASIQQEAIEDVISVFASRFNLLPDLTEDILEYANQLRQQGKRDDSDT